MKKTLLFIAAIFSAGAMIAQDITFNPSAPELALGEYIDYGDMTITNNTEAEMTLRFEQIELCNPSESNLQICLSVNCYQPTVGDFDYGDPDNWDNPDQVPTLTLAAGESYDQLSFHLYNFVMEQEGSKYEVIFYNEDNPEQFGSVVITVDVCEVSVSEFNGPLFEISEVSPNPVMNNGRINYNIPEAGEMVFYNMTGKLVHRMVVPQGEGVLNFDASSFTNGIYFYSLNVNGTPVMSKRMMVTK